MGKIALVFIVVMASATFYITSTSYQSHTTKPQQHTWFDDSGKLHVMGVILGESTVRDAELAFRSRSDAAIFMYPTASEDENMRFNIVLEAYFPSIADHSKVLLKLAISDEALEEMRQRSTSPRMYPNGVARRNLATEDILSIQNMVIRELTLVPSVQVDLISLQAQFGQVNETTSSNQGVAYYTFPKSGLTASINPEGKGQLVFSNSNNF